MGWLEAKIVRDETFLLSVEHLLHAPEHLQEKLTAGLTPDEGKQIAEALKLALDARDRDLLVRPAASMSPIFCVV